MNRDFGGQIALWQGNVALCQRGVCSSHCPLKHAHTHIQYTHMLTPSLKPISFAQGMGTPLISLLPLSSLPPHHPCPFAHPLSSCPFSFPFSSLFSTSLHHMLTLSCPRCVTLSGTPFFPRDPPVLLYAESLLFARFYFLPPSVPNLSRARSVFFPDNLFLIHQN